MQKEWRIWRKNFLLLTVPGDFKETVSKKILFYRDTSLGRKDYKLNFLISFKKKLSGYMENMLNGKRRHKAENNLVNSKPTWNIFIKILDRLH